MAAPTVVMMAVPRLIAMVTRLLGALLASALASALIKKSNTANTPPVSPRSRSS